MQALTTVIQQSILILLVLINCSIGYAQNEPKVFYDNMFTIEYLLKCADAIVVASVNDTGNIMEGLNKNNILENHTSLTIDSVVKSNNTIKKGDNIIVHTYEGSYDSNGILISPSYNKPIFFVGSKVLLLLSYNDGCYQLLLESYSKFDIVNGLVSGCDIPIEDYTKEISNVLHHDESFELPYPDFYINITPTKIAKIAEISETFDLPNDQFLFRPHGVVSPETLPLRIHYFINPANGYDYDGEYIGFDSLFVYVQEACNYWNAVSNGNVELSVCADSSSLAKADDIYSVITFGNSTAAANSETPTLINSNYYPYPNYESDITFESNFNWPLAVWDDISFERTIAHEIGHSLNLGDLGADKGDPLSYRYNLMWHTGGTTCPWYIHAPQYGDMLGLVYACPDLDGVFNNYNRVVIGDGTILYNTFNIPSGKELIIDLNSTIYIAPTCYINVYGDLSLCDGAKLTKRTGSTLWGGIDIEQGGKFYAYNLNGILVQQIEYAFYGFRYFDSTSGNGINITPGTRLIVRQCENFGLFSVGCPPCFSGIQFDNNGTNLNDSDIYISSSSGASQIDNVTMRFGQLGAYVNGGVIAEFNEIEIKQKNDHHIKTDSWSNIQLSNSNLCPTTGNYVLYQGSSTNTITATNNYWGIASPDSSLLFRYPNIVEWRPYEASPIDDAGAMKILPIISDADDFTIAHEYELRGLWSEAINIYNDIIADTNIEQVFVKALQKLIAAQDKSNKKYDAIKQTINENIGAMTGIYRPYMDILLCDLTAREGNAESAISNLQTYAEKYKDTPYEVEMLARAAIISKIFQDDEKQAKYFADLAASINPGQEVLRAAYVCADIIYDPGQHEDLYNNFKENKRQSEMISQEPIVIYPNPFNPATTISFTLSDKMPVALSVYSITGQKVATLVDGPMSAGAHALQFDGSGLASGLYVYRLESPGHIDTGKMLLIK